MIPSPPQNLTASSIDEVIASLDRIVAWAKAARSRTGYFAALYRQVTRQVRAGIREGFFEDGERMERLDVIFANRYLGAFEAFFSGRPASQVWTLAFTSAARWQPIVLQHLLVGMSAHIDMDLGIAAVETAPPGGLPALRGDFDRINGILGARVDDVQKALAGVWPLLKLIDFLARDRDEKLANFGLEITRGHAWLVAERLAPLSGAERVAAIEALDGRVALLARGLLTPGPLSRAAVAIIRAGELRAVDRVIELLE